MAQNKFTYELQSIILTKFGRLTSGIPTSANLKDTVDITLQVQEVSIFESIFEPALRCELAVIDPVGLIWNFPISGEEAIIIRFKTSENTVKQLNMVIDAVTDISVDPDARSVGYVIKCVSLEMFASAKQTVQQSYEDTPSGIAKKIFDEHIVQRLQKIIPSYQPAPLIIETADDISKVFVVPNVHPFAAIKFCTEFAVDADPDNSTFVFFQNIHNFYFTTIQRLFQNDNRQQRRAMANPYIYKSDQFDKEQDPNKTQVTDLVINKRLSSFDKISSGYFHNNHFEINMGQKNVWGQPTTTEDIDSMYTNKLNTKKYEQLVKISDADDEQSNRTRYVVTIDRENDNKFPVSRMRQRWGRDLISSIAMGQIDITVTIPGTVVFAAGDMFYLEIPEAHAFNKVDEDNLISGLFAITEVKHVLARGGFHATVLRINKDSYKQSIDRDSRYGTDAVK